MIDGPFAETKDLVAGFWIFQVNSKQEAIEFYRSKLGAQVTMLMRFKDSPEPHEHGMVPPGTENKVMHAALRIGMIADRFGVSWMIIVAP